MNKIGIMGATGQLGSALMRILNKRGEPLTRTSSKLDGIKDLVWVAGTSNSRCTSSEAEAEFCSIQNLISHLDFSCLEKVVLVSSGGTVYGNNASHPIEEAQKLNPISPYANLKVKIEREFERLSRSSDFSLKILRLANVYSAGGNGLIPTLLRNKNSRQVMHLWVRPESRKQYGHSDDYARIIIRYLDELTGDRTPQIHNVYSKYSYSIQEIVELVERTFGTQYEFSYPDLPLPLDSVELTSNFPDFIESHNWTSLENFVLRETM